MSKPLGRKHRTVAHVMLAALGIAAWLATAPRAWAQCGNSAIVSLATSLTVDPPMTAPDGAGGMFVAWADNRAGNFDIYVARVDGNGCLVAGWPANGVAVCTAVKDQVNPRIISDNAGGAFVAWEDGRNQTPTHANEVDVFAQHVLASGSLGWAANGVAVSVIGLNGLVHLSDVEADGTASAFVTWGDAFGQLDAQKLSPATGASVWGQGGVVVSGLQFDDPPLPWSPNRMIVPDGAGGAVVAFASRSNGPFVQRLAAATGAPQWSGPPALDTEADDVQLASDGLGAYYVTYAHEVGGSPHDIELSHFDNTGALTTGWPVVACGAAGDQRFPQIVPDGFNGVVLAWLDTRFSGDIHNAAVYATRIGRNGTRVGSCWAVDGNAVTAGSATGLELGLTPDGGGGAGVLWGVNYVLHARQIGGDASLGSDVSLATAAGPASATLSGGALSAAWQDVRSGFANAIYGAHSTLTPVVPAGLTSLAVAAVGTSGADMTWTVPADDPTFGPAVAFDIRWSQTSVTESNFSSQTAQFETTPSGPPGSIQCAPIAPMKKCWTSQVAMRVQYECGVWSSLSDIVPVTTGCRGFTLTDCSGFAMHPAPQDEDPLPASIELTISGPNPSRGTAQIGFAIPAANAGEPYELAAFDVGGRRVITIARGVAEVGRRIVTWDRGADGSLPSGTYFLRLRVGAETRTATLVLTR